MTKSQNRLITTVSWIAVAACMATIFFFSSQAASDSQSMSDKFAFLIDFTENAKSIIRKIAHFLEFAALGALLSNAFYFTFRKHRPLVSFICGCIYAASDELHQLFVEGRACRIFDVFIDSLGVISGIAFFTLLLFIFTRFTDPQSVTRRNSHDK